MNLRVYNAKDKLRETIDAMTYVKTNEELDKLFVGAAAELLKYDIELRKEINNCEELDPKQILNSVYGARNVKR